MSFLLAVKPWQVKLWPIILLEKKQPFLKTILSSFSTETFVVIFSYSVACFSLTTIVLALPLLTKSNDFNVAKADYAQEYTDNTKYIDDAQKVSIEISNEGFTLLKNKNNYLPIKKESKISVLGKNSVRIANGGEGSGAGYIQKGCIGCSMEKSLEDSGFIVNPDLLEFYKNNSKSGGGRTSGSSSWSSVSGQVSGETPLANYNDVLIASFDAYKEIAIVIHTANPGG